MTSLHDRHINPLILKDLNGDNWHLADYVKRGGYGALRRIRFLEAMTASILSNGRKVPSFGAAGGEPGQVGINRLVRQDGRVEELDHIGSAEMQPGDVFEVHTPGGGGYGKA